jgi:hypothetical protein
MIMQIELTPTEIAAALAKADPTQLMVLVAALASHDQAQALIAAAASRHNGTAFHRKAAPWLRQLADALEAVETRDAAIDAAGRVS